MPEHTPDEMTTSPATGISRDVDLRQISRALAQIAEEPAAPIERTEAILRYILSLMNGYGAFLNEPEVNIPSVQVWRADDSGFRDTILGDVRLLLEDARVSGAAQLYRVASMPGHFAMVAPFWHHRKLRGMVTVVTAAPSKESLKPYLIVLQAALGYMHYGLFRDESLDGLKSIEQSAAFAEMASLMCAAPYHEESVRVMALELRKHLRCAAVAVSRVKDAAKRSLKLEVISEAVDFDKRGEHANYFISAMREAVAAGHTCKYPQAEQTAPDEKLPAHEELFRSYSLTAVQSVPLRDEDDQLFAVITLIWKRSPQSADQINRFIAAMAPHLGRLYGGLRHLDPLRLRKYSHLFWLRFSPVKKWILAGLLCSAFIFLAWPTAYPVRVDAMVEPIKRRVVSAQFDGILKKSMVEPGQFVEVGQILAVMDDKQLLWRESELLASRDRALRQRDLAMTDSESAVASAQMAQLEAAGFETELELLDYQRENLSVRAPISGIVLAGDLERIEGVPVAQGESLFEIGVMDQVVLDLEIPADEINMLSIGAVMELRLASFPERQWSGVLEQINPKSIATSGGNFFIAEASLSVDEIEQGMLRAGMKGRATIEGETVPRIWTFTRRLWNYLHLKFFW